MWLPHVSVDMSGFIIERARAEGYLDEQSGGGIYFVHVDAVVSEVRFRWNNAEKTGAAIKTTASNLTIARCSFDQNWGVSGGGAIDLVHGTLSISDCTFSENAGIRGGALCADSGVLNVSRCTFRDGSSTDGGGMYLDGTIFDFQDLTVINNSSTRFGGAIRSPTCKGSARSCRFEANNAVSQGGGIYMGTPTTLLFIDCTFLNNHSKYAGAERLFRVLIS
jgi:predicted outer membrane repeat protein